jgi:hypothetical protein
VAIGYQFGYGWVQPFVRERLLRPYRIDSPGRHGELVEPSIPARFSFSYRSAYQVFLELAQTMPPLFVPANDREEQIAHFEATIAATTPSHKGTREHLQALLAELQAMPSAHDLVAELEALLGTLPLSVRVWYEEVGGVNLVGDHPDWRALLPESVLIPPMDETEYVNPMHVLDPLQILPLDGASLAKFRTPQHPRAAGEWWRTHAVLNLAPGEWMKYLDNSSDGGTYVVQMLLPALGADAPCVIPGNQMFVAYLRECFRWGGFRGWAKFDNRPEQDLAFLTRDLLPL